MGESPRIAAGSAHDLPPGGRKLVFVPGREAVVVFHVDDRYYAIDNQCPHAGASLASGACEGHTLACPAHGLRFDLRTGRCTASPGLRIPAYSVVEEAGQLWLSALADDPPPVG